MCNSNACATAVTNNATQDALAERVFHASIQTLEMFSLFLGKRLGLYDCLAERGAQTAPQLADNAGIDARYAREWLEQQAVAGFLRLDADAASADSRSYALPTEHRGVLCDPEHPAQLAPLAQMIGGIAAALPRVAEAYQSGEGVPYADYGADFRDGQGGINRPAFLQDLCGEWLPSIPELQERLLQPGARIADIGCGQGWSTIAMADAYPDAKVVGLDLDPASIEDAQTRAAARDSRAEFRCIDGSQLAEQGPFDCVLMVEVLHDLAHPHHVLAAIRQTLAPGGSLIIADERVAERFRPDGDPTERMMYGWSVTHCLPASMAEPASRAIGTAIRPSLVKSLAEEAGFEHCEVLPLETDFFRFYRLR